MKNRKILSASLAAIMAVSFSGCNGNINDEVSSQAVSDTVTFDDNETAVSSLSAEDISVSAEDKDVGYEESDSTNITFSGSNAEINGSGAALSDGTLSITEAGTYVLSGSFNGQVLIQSKGSEIKLVLNGVSVVNDTHAALLIDKASKVTLTLNDNTENSFTDGSEYKLSGDDDNTDAAVFSRSDLTINGGGSLTVSGNYKHGIVCKDELVITGGDINVTAASSGIKGKDAVKISGGTIDITAGSNGIAAANSGDETKGFVAVTGGTVVINSDGDGIQAETTLRIEDGTLDITTGGGSENASMKSDGSPNGDWGNWGGGHGGMGGERGGFGKRGEMGDMTPPDGTGEMGNMEGMIPPDGFGGEMNDDMMRPAENAQPSDTADSTDNSENSTSAKALKAGKSVEIAGGSIKIDSSDDSVHSGGNVYITGGTFTANSGDDGIHADSELEISGGSVDIQKSYEGIEGLNITVSGGDVKVKAADDGFNAAGGSDTGSFDRMGRDSFNTSDGTNYRLTISGGKVYVNADGDGLDSNGDLYVTGGIVCVDGTTNGGNGALDYGDFGSTAQITGGTLVALGAVGMEVGFDETSTQYSILHNFSSTAEAGSKFTVADSEGNEIFSFTSAKSWQSAVFSSSKLAEGTYTLTAGEQSEKVEISSIVTSNSTGMSFGRR